MTNVEYAVWNGEGTLLDYGMADALDVSSDTVVVVKFDRSGRNVSRFYQGAASIARPCDENCETGR